MMNNKLEICQYNYSNYINNSTIINIIILIILIIVLLLSFTKLRQLFKKRNAVFEVIKIESFYNGSIFSTINLIEGV